MQDAVEWCRRYGLEFDAVNENLPELVKEYGNDCRKVYYDVLIDDKSADKRKYGLPFRVGKEMVSEPKPQRKAKIV